MSQFRNLVFEGGGVKGIAYAGAIGVLEENGILPDIRRVAGTSAGAITAALLALGASSQNIQEIVGGTDFREFMDDSWGVLRDINRLITHYGWYKGDRFEEWMRQHISDLTGGRADMTFSQLARLATDEEASSYRQLWMVASNLSMQSPQVFSARTTGDVPIWRAVRMSMSIPLFFAAADYKENVMVDGGVTWNYPVDIFFQRSK
jgi:NTE family protein